jgi:hypothetical protein
MRFWLAALFFLVFCIGAHADVVIDDSKSYPDSYTTPRGEKGAVTIKCTGVKVVVDTSLPSEGGAAGTDVILLNPNMLNKQPKAVRLFVFAHECGHTQPEIDDSELLADKYAVKRGVEEGWLDEAGLKQVCESFDDAPATRTHPSGRTRCTANAKWFAEYSKHADEQSDEAKRIVPLKELPPATYNPNDTTPKFEWHAPWWWRWLYGVNPQH